VQIMTNVEDTYPVFEANQVLSNAHLNQLFDYLDQQDRLSRTNLTGIGILCGFALRYDAAQQVIHVGPGCGITSEGYLAVQPVPLALTAYREYILPPDIDYSPFRDKAQANNPSYSMWELFPAGEPETTAISSPASFLDDKVVVVFVELKKSGLRNCSPNDCNDKGGQVTSTLRYLLLAAGDMDKVIAEAGALDSGLSTAELLETAQKRLQLPDLRLPRFDVPRTSPVTSAQVLDAFHAVFRKLKLAEAMRQALNAAYDAFKPLVKDRFPANPFGDFASKYGFLDNSYGDPAQVRFVQYYVDLFDDMIRAYDDMRWAGIRLICACVPPADLFPRHLMLGVPRPVQVNEVLRYRTGFLPACAGTSAHEDFLALFERLVALIAKFTHQPVLIESAQERVSEPGIAITPSANGPLPLAAKALPYYYRLDSAPRLNALWSPELHRLGRSNQVLSYRSSEYDPAAPAFVTGALRFDLEPYNFLRIEGHLGKSSQAVLSTLLTLRSRYRLPFDVVALQTGSFDEDAPLQPGDTAQIPELETLYDVLREEILFNLAEGIRNLYMVQAETNLPAGVPKHPLLKERLPQFRYEANSLGAWFEKYLTALLSRPYIDVDHTNIDSNAILMVYCSLFTGTTGLTGPFWPHVVAVYYMSKLAEVLPASLTSLTYPDFENKAQDLLGLSRHFRDQEARKVVADLKQFVPSEELIDQFDGVLYGCNLAPVKALHEEYVRRLRDLKQARMLSSFLQKHPGVQHKAGVPMGGTFILVVHQKPARPAGGDNLVADTDRIAIPTRDTGTAHLVRRALSRISTMSNLAADPDVLALVDGLRGGRFGDLGLADQPGAAAEEDGLQKAVDALDDGVVIADFFLPYLCCGGGNAIQYVLPQPPLGLTVTLGCTDAAGTSQVTLTPQGGLLPISYQLDGQPYKTLGGPVSMTVGEHTVRIRDSAGSESAMQTVTVPSTLRIEEERFEDDVEGGTWRVFFTIVGGTMPYKAEPGTVEVNRYASDPVPSGQTLTVAITDSAGCTLSRAFTHEVAPACDLPCDGFALRCGYRFWVPDNDRERKFESIGIEVPEFSFEGRNGQRIDLRSAVQAAFGNINAEEMNSAYERVVQAWIKRINQLIAEAVGSIDWLVLTYDTRSINGLPVLWIEYFECLKFDIHIQTFFRRNGGNQVLDVHYTQDGTIVRGRQEPVLIPKFNCSRIAKCDPQRPVTMLCQGAGLGLVIQVTQMDGEGIGLRAEVRGPNRPAHLIWEVTDGEPLVLSGPEVRFRFISPTPLLKTARLLGITAQGCLEVVTRTVNIG
jgi:hypothetical protein